MRVSCFECALRACGLFKPVSQTELAFINDMKRDHLVVRIGTEIVRAGQDSDELYTLYSGLAFRFKNLPDGRRQILNFLLPGDLLGLQAAMFDVAQHRIEALTEVELHTQANGSLTLTNPRVLERIAQHFDEVARRPLI
jgi:CRP-like cAMP-binding protein